MLIFITLWNRWLIFNLGFLKNNVQQILSSLILFWQYKKYLLNVSDILSFSSHLVQLHFSSKIDFYFSTFLNNCSNQSTVSVSFIFLRKLVWKKNVMNFTKTWIFLLILYNSLLNVFFYNSMINFSKGNNLSWIHKIPYQCTAR